MASAKNPKTPAPASSIPTLAIAVASRRKPFDPAKDDQLGRQCYSATQGMTANTYLRQVRADYVPGQEFIPEAQWTLVSEFGARWKSGLLRAATHMR